MDKFKTTDVAHSYSAEFFLTENNNQQKDKHSAVIS